MLSNYNTLIVLITCSFVNVVITTGICLDKDETRYIQSMQYSLKTLKVDLGQLKRSLKEKSQDSQCQAGWKTFRDSCYYFSTYKSTWYLAERYCRTHGSSLVDVTDEAENEWLKSKLTGAFFGFWLGASNMKRDQWLWNVNFKPLTYTKWNSGEPNSPGAQCIHMIGKVNNQGGLWNDDRCEVQVQYVCKKKKKCDCQGEKGNRG